MKTQPRVALLGAEAIPPVDDQLDDLLERLHLGSARRNWRRLVERAEKEEWSFRAFLARLAAEEIAQRQQTRPGLDYPTPGGPIHGRPYLARISGIRRPVTPEPAPAACPSLTQRENEILQCVAAGHQNKEVAQKLDISLATARNHVHNILTKLEVHSKLEAVSLAFRQGWVTCPAAPSMAERDRPPARELRRLA